MKVQIDTKNGNTQTSSDENTVQIQISSFVVWVLILCFGGIIAVALAARFLHKKTEVTTPVKVEKTSRTCSPDDGEC